MLLVFWLIFSLPVKSRIESIGGRRVGGGWGKAGAGWKSKATIWTQAAVLCPQYGTRTGTFHSVGQDCRQEQLGTPCSPINAPQGREMHPCGFTTLVKSPL